jgi:hypothetical protein
VFALPIQEEISRSRYIPESDLDELDAIGERIEKDVRALVGEGVGAAEAT